MCDSPAVLVERQYPVPAPRLGATALVLARCAGCVHRVRRVLTGHGLSLAGPRVEPDLVAVVADDPVVIGALLEASIRVRPSARHLVLTSGPVDDAAVLPAVRAGADGCLPVDLPVRAMAASIAGLLRGEVALPRGVVGALLSEVRLRPGRTVRRDDGRPVELTTREWQVLELLASGHSTREAARALHVGEATVRGYLKTAATRMRVTGRADAVRVFRGGRHRDAWSDAMGSAERGIGA